MLSIVRLALLVCLIAGPAAAAPPKVVASVKPVQSLVAAVMEGVGAPALLVPGAASPHTYTLRPSDARLLRGAGLVFWIGPIYESFLEKPVAALGGGAIIVRLADAPGVSVLRQREGGAWGEEEAHHHESGFAGSAGDRPSDDPEGDGHVWLDPRNARAMAAAIAEALAAADPADAARYRENAATTARRLDALEDELARRLAAVQGRPFVVFHDAYQYFERRFGLDAIGSIALHPDQKPGARRVRELQARIRDLGGACVFSEPQFEPALVRTLVVDSGARTGVLDPLGADVPDGPEAYFTVMRRLADSLVACLAG
jgi:zinc transport system substrate-binding protein